MTIDIKNLPYIIYRHHTIGNPNEAPHFFCGFEDGKPIFTQNKKSKDIAFFSGDVATKLDPLITNLRHYYWNSGFDAKRVSLAKNWAMRPKDEKQVDNVHKLPSLRRYLSYDGSEIWVDYHTERVFNKWNKLITQFQRFKDSGDFPKRQCTVETITNSLGEEITYTSYVDRPRGWFSNDYYGFCKFLDFKGVNLKEEFKHDNPDKKTLSLMIKEVVRNAGYWGGQNRVSQ